MVRWGSLRHATAADNNNNLRSNSSTGSNKLSVVVIKRKYLYFFCLLVALSTNGLFRTYSATQSRVLTAMDAEEWESFQADYKQRYNNRQPPQSLRPWLTFAKSLGCETKKYYDVIDYDLQAFRKTARTADNVNRTLVPLDQVLKEAGTYSNYRIEFSLHNHVLRTHIVHDPNASWLNRFETYWIARAYQWLLRPLVQHQPPLTTNFVVSLHDGPRSPSNARAPIFSVSSQSYLTETDRPARNQAEHLQNVFQTTTNNNDDSTRDLLIPYYLSIGSFYFAIGHARGIWCWPFYRHGRKWTEREPTVGWRGSTTGDWLTGPRFELVRRFGGSGIQPLRDAVADIDTASTAKGKSSAVQADIAFMRVLQNDGREQLDSSYRFASSVQYSDIQKHRYVMDVDGNGT
jgi:hypothetical protein